MVWALSWELGTEARFPSPCHPALLSELREKLCQRGLNSQPCQVAYVKLQPLLSCLLRIGASIGAQTISSHTASIFPLTLAVV